jgi:hypothetical protein
MRSNKCVIPVLNTEIIVLNLQIQVGEDELQGIRNGNRNLLYFLLDPLPENSEER